MDFKKPTWGTGFFPSTIITFFITISMLAQTKNQAFAIQNSNRTKALEGVIANFKKEESITQSKILALTKAASFKLSEKQLDGTFVALNTIGTDGTPIFYTTYTTANTNVSRSKAFYSGGVLNTQVTGFGMQVGIWDAGTALPTHQEFGNRVVSGDASEDIDSHTTMVTGAIVSSGIKAKAKGVAFEARAMTHDWARDRIEVAEAAADGLLVSNHSYGIKTDRVPDWYFGSYIKVSQDWDKIMYNAPYYLMVSAAGNAQRSQDNGLPNFGKTADGYDLLLGFATSKNGLVIAGADTKINSKGELKNAEASSYSSFGPIDDGRIKPDLAGDGSLIFSTGSANEKSYKSAMGTSMAAPGVTGSLLLLQQYHEELYGSFMKAATLKGLVLHTADDVQEAGPDYKMGWGVINTQRAGEALKHRDFSSKIVENTLKEGEVYEMKVTASGKAPLQVSISWTDVEGSYTNRGELNATTPALVNDLDIRITKDDETYFPWKLDASQANAPAKKGDNSVDPFERVDIDDAVGTYTVTISHKGSLFNENQDLSLIITGAELTQCTLVAPEELRIENAMEMGCTIGWPMNNETLYEFEYKVAGANDWISQTTWDNTVKLDFLEIGKRYQARVRAVCTENLASEYSEELQFEFDGEDTEVLTMDSFNYTDDLAIGLYPNPAVNEIFIEAELSLDAVYTIRNTAGITIKKGNANEAQINVSTLASGMYFLTVEDYSGVKSSKFFKR